MRFHVRGMERKNRNIQWDVNFLNLLLPLHGDWLSGGIYSLIDHCRIRMFVPYLFILSWHSYLLIHSLIHLRNPLSDNNPMINSLSLVFRTKSFLSRKKSQLIPYHDTLLTFSSTLNSVFTQFTITFLKTVTFTCIISLICVESSRYWTTYEIIILCP